MKKCLSLAVMFLSFSFLVQAQQSLTLDQALTKSINEVAALLPSKSKSVVISYETPSKLFSDYVGDVLTYIYQTKINRNMVTYNHKADVDSIRKNYKVEDSYISEEKAVEIGKALGADHVIFVTAANLGTTCQLTIQPLSVGSTKKYQPVRYTIKEDGTLTELLKAPPVTESSPPTEGAVRRLRSQREAQENT
ncbi:MAG: hypothetical protein Ta2F_06880 [Termitinemataceae bacterium]|nr:MAG: hypothetical protein Ta2F_06880 [Termitinemataceae bacterium]